MGIAELLLTAIALSMDAFAVSVCKGLATKKVRVKEMLVCGLWFGGFQALMPLIGYFLGKSFASVITSIDHWITFFLLAAIGINMLKEALEDDEETDSSLGFKVMLTMAFATSVDALAVGIGFAALGDGVNIPFAISAIGIITFILSAVGVKIGEIFGSRWRAPAEFAGGIVLVGIGLKILIEHALEDKQIYDVAIGSTASLIFALIFSVMAFVLLKRRPLEGETKRLLLLDVALGALFLLAGIGLSILYFIIK